MSNNGILINSCINIIMMERMHLISPETTVSEAFLIKPPINRSPGKTTINTMLRCNIFCNLVHDCLVQYCITAITGV